MNRDLDRRLGPRPVVSLPLHFPRTKMSTSRSSSLTIPLLDLHAGPSNYHQSDSYFGDRCLNRVNAMPEGNFESHANKIVEKLEKDNDLMEDTPLSEQLRKEALRDLPQCMTMKRCVKTKLSKSVSQKCKHRPIGCWKSLKYRFSINFSKFSDIFRDFSYFKLWHGTLKDIEGHFGSGYAAYFKFLRWLFVLNCFTAVLPLIFIAVPQILFDFHSNGTQPNTETFQFKNIFVGNGFLNETLLYYGHYTHKTINLIPNLNYSMPVAYFTTNVVLYIVSFLVLSFSVAQSYRRNFIETEAGLKNVFANKIFCGWDYSIANKEAAELKSSAIYNELKEQLSESLRIRRDRGCFEIFTSWIMHIVTNIIIACILAGTGFGLWRLLEQFADHQDDRIVVTAIVVNIVIMVYPTAFTYIAKYEDYSNPRVALYISLFRTFVLGIVIIGVVVAFWLSNADSNRIRCWETCLAQEMYRLILFDFIFSVLFNLLLEIACFLFLRFSEKHEKVEFNVAKHCLQINYNQALFWVGLFYSPLLPMVVIFKMLIMWYIRAISLKKLCKPPARTWKAAQTQTWFLVMTFISNLLIIAVHGYSFKSISTSNTCGPLRSYTYSYEIITEGAADLERSGDFWKFVILLTKPGAVALIIIALCVLVYYMREKALTEVERVRLLREMLIWESQDKQFLQAYANHVTNGRFKNQFNRSQSIDPILTQPTEYFPDSSGDYDVFQGPETDFFAIHKKYS